MKRIVISGTIVILAAACSHAAALEPQGEASLLPVPRGSQHLLASAPRISWNHTVYMPGDSAPPVPQEEAVGGDFATGINLWTDEAFCCDGNCCDGGMSCSCCCSCWYAGARGLMMTRDEENDTWLTFDTSDTTSRALTTNHASMEWDAGIEFTVGRYFDCGWAIETTYWGIFSDLQEASAFDPAPPAGTLPNINSAVDFSSLDYDNGASTSGVDTWYDGAQQHRLRRDYEFHNLELNLVRGGFGWGGGCCATPRCCGLGCSCGRCCSSNLCVDMFAGVRYFKFDETFQFATDDANTIFGDDALNELFYDINLDNNLVGFQLGGRADYQLTCCCSLYIGTKFGLYGNRVTHHSRIGGANGAATVNNGANTGRAFDIRSTKNDVAFLGELDLGLAYSINPQWRATLGYRAIGVTGVALTTNQMPVDFADVDGVADIDSNGSLILHGAYCGLEFNW